VVDRLARRGFRGRLYLMLSNGGLTSSAVAAEFPVRVVESGPAAGAMGAEVTARRLGLSRVLAFDMGGTTAKACVIRDGRLSRAHEFEVAREARFKRGSGIPVRVPVVDLLEIGAGGGSIAAPNALGLLEVGPESAGADPGPACYARGGKAATVTDADLLLGYLDAEAFLGGRMRLDRAAAEAAVQRSVAAPLGLSASEAAWAIHDLVNENMAAAARVHFAEKAEEPGQYALMAFGGAGPVHAAGLAWKLGIRHVVIPVSPGIFAALSFFAAPMMYDAVRTHKVRLADLDPSALGAIVDELGAEAARFLEVARPDELDWDASLDMRYAGQGYDIVVPLSGRTASVAEIGAAFDAAYGRLYGRILGDVEREIVNVRLSARRTVHRIEMPAPGGPAVASPPRPRTRLAWDPQSGSYVPFTVARREELWAGATLPGPCIVEEAESTTVLPYPGRLTVDREGNLHVDLGGLDR
jgi:N-methylhydantoinase A/oxoprolinase/acetone carboxylase beta subunit